MANLKTTDQNNARPVLDAESLKAADARLFRRYFVGAALLLGLFPVIVWQPETPAWLVGGFAAVGYVLMIHAAWDRYKLHKENRG